MRKRRAYTTDGLEILHHRYFEGRPERLAELELVRQEAAIARKIHDLRTGAGLTQQQLARLVGTATSVISRLEDADYDGYSLKTLQRIAAALNCVVEVRFVPRAKRGRRSKAS
jgi:DNA-binding XRE family transcriptional regulator